MSILRTKKKSFRHDQSGLVGPVFGMMAIPLLAVTGAAIDYSKAISKKFEMQQKLDAATVAVCTRGTRDAEDLIRAYLNGAGVDIVEPPAGSTEAPVPTPSEVVLTETNFDPITNVIKPRIEAQVETAFLKIIGINEFNIEVSSGVACGSKRLELAVMMDTTGSMNSKVNGKKKIDSMKEASHDLIDIFKSNMQAEATRIAMVPFAEAVNVGSYAEAARGSYNSGWSYSPGHYQYKYKKSRSKWRTDKISNCVSERTGTDAYTNAPPSTSYVGRVYTSNGSCKPSYQIVPLTNDEDTLRNKINSLGTSGGTAGHIGTAWSWYLISESWGYMFPEASRPEPKNEEELTKAVILMTDGDYNEEYCNGVDTDRIYNCGAPNGNSKYQAEQLCEAMKDDDVVVYTVGFGISNNSSQQQLLKDCASDNTKYFFPYNGEQLRAAFAEIGAQLAAGQAGKAVVAY